MRKNLLINLLLAAVASLLALWLIFMGLNFYTRHNESVDVPNVKGEKIETAIEKIENAGLRYEIFDSVYSDDFKKNTITEQDPDPGSKVKPGRIIYLTLNSLDVPMVKVPKLTDQSLALTKAMIKSAGFKLGEITYKHDAIGNNLVIEQLHNGDHIPPGKMLQKGSVIDLVVATTSMQGAPSTDDSAGVDAGIMDGELPADGPSLEDIGGN
jgi:beta-lactam-binding protein with PASTA domain